MQSGSETGDGSRPIDGYYMERFGALARPQPGAFGIDVHRGLAGTG